MALILNQSQAEAVYSAMCALNEVSHTAGVQVSFVGYDDDDEGPRRITVVEDAGGHVEVLQGPTPHPIAVERHANQSAFATAYGLRLYEADPLQGAANWLVEAHPGIETSALAGKLSIGYNRAKRLHDATAYGLNADEPQGQKYTTNRYCHASMCLDSDQKHEADCPQGRCVRSTQPQSDVAAAAGGLTQVAIER